MRKFAELYTRLDQTTKTNAKIDALADYFAEADPVDTLWTVALLIGKRPKRTIKTGELKQWAVEMAQLPSWLFDESYHIVGDLAETISLVLPSTRDTSNHSLHGLILLLKEFDLMAEEEKKETIQKIWNELNTSERLVFNKLITGSFRVGVSQQLVIKALAKRFALKETQIAHRLMGDWNPEQVNLEALLFQEHIHDDVSKPYPFYLAYQLEMAPEELGDVSNWQVERKYDGIRGQLIVRKGQLFIWSRGEDLMTDKLPEFAALRSLLPDGTVIDGEILPFKNELPMAFHVMQTRIGRKNLTKKALQDAPLVLLCYDLLEHQGKDIREMPLQKRRQLLEDVLHQVHQKENTLQEVLRLSPILPCRTPKELARLRLESREYLCEGLMLKHKESPYESGRRRGKWWKWKIDPLTVDGVLLYAQRGHGRRANLYTDYTFAVWDRNELVPFAKAYSGLTDKELLEVDAWVKKNTKEKFGPVRSVTPELVFEIAFEGINPSPRHKSGVALRFPRILRWRKDKVIEEANSKEDLLMLIQQQASLK